MTETIQSLIEELLGAVRCEDHWTCAELYLPDGLIVSPPGPDARGRHAIAALHRQKFDAGERVRNMVVLESAADTTLGYCIVGWSAEYLQCGENELKSGRSFNIVRWIPADGWRFAVSTLSVDPL